MRALKEISKLVSTLALASALYSSNAQDLKIEDFPSPNFDSGRKSNIEKIVLHSTEGCGESALREFSERKNKKSSHYLVIEDGTTYRLVSDGNTAWHVAGANPFTLGIELAGYANKSGFNFTGQQYTNTALLALNLMQKYNLSKKDIIAHGDIPAKFNKNVHTDPDPNFDWNRFYSILDSLSKNKKGKREYDLDVTVVEEVASTAKVKEVKKQN